MGQLTDCPCLPFYPWKLGEEGSLAVGGWEAASSEGPAGSGSVATGSSALFLFLLASWNWCRRATSAFRFSKSFWLRGMKRMLLITFSCSKTLTILGAVNLRGGVLALEPCGRSRSWCAAGHGCWVRHLRYLELSLVFLWSYIYNC